MKFLLPAIGLLVTVLAVFAILVLLPADHFVRTRRTDRSVAWRVIRNVLGVVLALAGIALMVLPGPGLLAIIVGVSMLDFAGKRRLEERLLCGPCVLEPINALRRRVGRAPLIAPCPAELRRSAFDHEHPRGAPHHNA